MNTKQSPGPGRAGTCLFSRDTSQLPQQIAAKVSQRCSLSLIDTWIFPQKGLDDSQEVERLGARHIHRHLDNPVRRLMAADKPQQWLHGSSEQQRLSGRFFRRG